MKQIQEALEQDSGQITKQRGRKFSLQLLADSRLEQWSRVDNICSLHFKPDWDLNNWISGLRAEVVRIICNTVVIYLENTVKFTDVNSLKNKLLALCQVIRQHNKGARIFIANLLPQPSMSPVTRARVRVQSDFMLLQAVRGVNRMLKKVHYLSIFEHFTSSKSGRIIRPTHKYYQENRHLTVLGCMIFRECILHEAGLKSYWFK